MYEDGLEPLRPHLEDAIGQMMECFPKHKANYPITTLCNWQSKNAKKELPNGNIQFEPYESVDWYIARAKVKAMQQNCWQSRNEDARNMCLAKVKNSSDYCWQIRNEDEKRYCLAIIKSDRNYCWQIRDEDKKRECLALL